MTIEQQRVTINLSENYQLFTKHDTWPKFAAQRIHLIMCNSLSTFVKVKQVLVQAHDL